MRKESSSSVEIKYTNPAEVDAAVREWAESLRRNNSSVRRVIWFGSWTRGEFRPGSDVDACLIVHASDRSPRERAAEFLPPRFPVGMDLFVYTEAEFANLEQSHPEWYAAITSGIQV